MLIEDIVINATAKQIENMATRQISQEITESSSVDELASAKAVYNAVKNASGGGTGGGNAPLIVTLNPTSGMASVTGYGISTAVDEGRSVYLEVDGKRLPLSYLNPEYDWAYFADYENENVNESLLYTIFSEGYYEENATNLAFLSYQIGDISSALDEIREYAESLINGGGSV